MGFYSWDGSAMREKRESSSLVSQKAFGSWKKSSIFFRNIMKKRKRKSRVVWKWNLYSILMFWWCGGLILWICPGLILCWCGSCVNFLGLNFFVFVFLFKINLDLNSCDFLFLILFLKFFYLVKIDKLFF